MVPLRSARCTLRRPIRPIASMSPLPVADGTRMCRVDEASRWDFDEWHEFELRTLNSVDCSHPPLSRSHKRALACADQAQNLNRVVRYSRCGSSNDRDSWAGEAPTDVMRTGIGRNMRCSAIRFRPPAAVRPARMMLGVELVPQQASAARQQQRSGAVANVLLWQLCERRRRVAGAHDTAHGCTSSCAGKKPAAAG